MCAVDIVRSCRDDKSMWWKAVAVMGAGVAVAAIAVAVWARPADRDATADAATRHTAKVAPATRQVVYEPWNLKGHLDPGLIPTVETGQCFSGSIGDPRVDAWRCSAGNSIFDPCFSRPYSVTGPVICPGPAPWRSHVVELRLGARLPERYANKVNSGPGETWLRLANGATCEVLTGETPELGNLRGALACSDQAYVDRVSTDSPRWQVQEFRYWSQPAIPLRTIAVAQAWS